MAQRLGGSWNHMWALSPPCLVANASLLAGTSARAVARTSIGGLPCGFFFSYIIVAGFQGHTLQKRARWKPCCLFLLSL